MKTDDLIAKIEHEISINGGNKHKYPLTLGLSSGKWSVVVEVNSRHRTFDVETESRNLPVALAEALTAVRRQFSAS